MMNPSDNRESCVFSTPAIIAGNKCKGNSLIYPEFRGFSSNYLFCDITLLEGEGKVFLPLQLAS